MVLKEDIQKREKGIITLAAVGDLALGDHPARVGNGVGSLCKRVGYDYPFREVNHLFSNYDYVFGNLEYAFKSAPKKQHLLKSQCIADPIMSGTLLQTGFKILNVANNHIAQFGTNTFYKTIDLLKGNNIIPIGIADNTSKNTIPVISDVKGLKLGWLGYSLRPRQHFTGNPPYAEDIEDNILEDIRSLRLKVNHVIVSLHWGDEFIEKPSPGEILLAHKMIDNGASVILGHHPHVLRGIEIYKEGLIAYSLGNFVCDMMWENRLRESMILEITFSSHKIKEYNIIPIFINQTFQPSIIYGEERDWFFKRQEIRDKSILDVLNLYTPERYKEEALIELKLNRRATQKYFLNHIRQYPPKIILQQFMQSIKSRFEDVLFSVNKGKR